MHRCRTTLEKILIATCLVVTFWSGKACGADLILSGALTISRDTTFDSVVIQSAGILTADAAITVTGNMRVASGGIVTHSLRLLSGLVLNVAETLDVQGGVPGGLIDLNFLGLRGGNNGSVHSPNGEAFDPSSGTIVSGAQGGSQGGVGLPGGGASYGGAGGNGTTGGVLRKSTNASYGLIESPVFLGSGGGSPNIGPTPGGSGGGRVTITASTCVVNGTIRANGGSGVGWQGNMSGAGSGGSILIHAGSLTGGGAIQAIGGIGLHDAQWNFVSGSGGGGRIAIYYDALSFASTSISARGGNDANTGAAGTIYLKDNAQSYGDIIVDNAGIGSGNYTPFRTALTNLKSITTKSASKFDMRGMFVTSDYIAVESGTLVLADSIQMQNASELRVIGTVNGKVQLSTGALLSGTGTINGDVLNSGIIAPGGSVGRLTINGNLVQNSTGWLQAELGGTIAGTQYDQLDVNGNATLAGTLSVSYVNLFQPIVGDSFRVIDYQSHVGSFSGFQGLDTTLIGVWYRDSGVVLLADSSDVVSTQSHIVLSPAGSIPFTVNLRDQAGSPVVGSNDVWLDFGAAQGTVGCPTEILWPIVYPQGVSGPDGNIRFWSHAGGCSNDAVTIRTSHGVIGKVPVKSLDLNGSLLITASDFTGGVCNDYNNDGVVDFRDWDFLGNYLGQTCLDVPANYTKLTVFTIPGPGAIFQGDTIQVCAKVVNTSDNDMLIDSVIFTTAGWGISMPWTELDRFTSTNLNRLDSITLCKPFLVPPSGHGCFQVHIYPRFLSTFSSPMATLMPAATDSVVYGVRTDGANHWAYIEISNGQELEAVQYDSSTEVPDYSTARLLGKTQEQLRAGVGMDQSASVDLLQSDLVGIASSLWSDGFPWFAGTPGELEILNGMSGDLSLFRGVSQPRGNQPAIKKMEPSSCNNDPVVCGGTEPPESDYCTCSPDGWWKSCCKGHDLCFWAGGSWWDRFKCNAELTLCMVLHGAPPMVAAFYGGGANLFGGGCFDISRPPGPQPPGKGVQLNIDTRRGASGSPFANEQKGLRANQSGSVSSLLQRDTIFHFEIPVGNSNGDSLILIVNSFLPAGWKHYLNRSGLILTPDTISVDIVHDGLIECQDTGRVIISAYTMLEQYAGNAEVMVTGDTCNYVCGDADGEGTINIADAVYLISYIFTQGPAPLPLAAGDTDCDGVITIADVVYLINYIFSHGPQPCAGCK